MTSDEYTEVCVPLQNIVEKEMPEGKLEIILLCSLYSNTRQNPLHCFQ